MLCIQAATWAGCHPFAILLLVCKCHVDIEISLHCLVLTIYGYTVMQLCSFKMRGVKREENKFYYILIYIITIYLVRKTFKIGKRAKNNCITV